MLLYFNIFYVYKQHYFLFFEFLESSIFSYISNNCVTGMNLIKSLEHYASSMVRKRKIWIDGIKGGGINNVQALFRSREQKLASMGEGAEMRVPLHSYAPSAHPH